MTQADSLIATAKRLAWAWWSAGGNPERAGVANANEAWDAFSKAGQTAWIAVARAAASEPQTQTNTALLGVLKNLAELASYAEIVGGISVNRPGIRKWCDKAFDLWRAYEATPVRCPECGWCGHVGDLGQEGECGSGEECQGRPAEIIGQSDMIQAWIDTDGMVCGPQLVALGLVVPDPGTEDAAREEWGAETLWRLSEAGEAILRDARAQAARAVDVGPQLEARVSAGQAVPEGWALFPVDPTPEMLRSMWHPSIGGVKAARQAYDWLRAAVPPAPSAWRPIAETDKHGAPLLIGWLDSAGVWQARRAWWDPEFTTSDEWDEHAGCYRYAGAWTDGAVADWVCEARQSYDPTHVAALPAPPPGVVGPSLDAGKMGELDGGAC